MTTPSDKPVFTRIIRTCAACPSQWDAWDTDGRYYYLRYRYGVGTVTRHPSPNSSQWTLAELNSPVAQFRHGDKFGGSMDLPEFLQRSGCGIVAGAEISGEDIA